MAETRQELLSKLTKVRHELAESQMRVAELEALLSKEEPNPSALLDGEGFARNKAVEETLSLAKFPSKNPNPLLRVASDGTLLYANPASHRLLTQWACEVGTRLPEDLQRVISDSFAAAMSREVEVNCGDILYSLTFVPFGDANYVHLYGQDITERKRSEMSLKRYAQRMEILHQIDLGLIQGGSIQALVEVTLKHLRQLVPCQRADVSIMDEATNEALVFAVDLDNYTTLGQGVRVPIPPNVFEGYDERHIRVFDDFRGLQDKMPRARRLVNEGLLCALSAVLMDRERPIGVLGLFADTPGYFTAEHQEIAAEITSQLAIAIRQLQLSEELTRHAAELEQKVVARTA